MVRDELRREMRAEMVNKLGQSSESESIVDQLISNSSSSSEINIPNDNTRNTNKIAVE